MAKEKKVTEKPDPIKNGTKVECDDGVERKVIDRKTAIEKELTRFFTGVKCPHGHMAERKVKGYGCVTCVSTRRKEALKNRLANDPEFKEARAEKRRERHKKRYAEDEDYRKKILDRGKAKRATKADAKDSGSVKKAAENQIKDKKK